MKKLMKNKKSEKVLIKLFLKVCLKVWVNCPRS